MEGYEFLNSSMDTRADLIVKHPEFLMAGGWVCGELRLGCFNLYLQVLCFTIGVSKRLVWPVAFEDSWCICFSAWCEVFFLNEKQCWNLFQQKSFNGGVNLKQGGIYGLPICPLSFFP